MTNTLVRHECGCCYGWGASFYSKDCVMVHVLQPEPLEKEVEPPQNRIGAQVFRSLVKGVWIWVCTFGAILLQGGSDFAFGCILASTWLASIAVWRRVQARGARRLMRRPRNFKEWVCSDDLLGRVPIKAKDVIGRLGEEETV